MPGTTRNIVILGGGFAGLYAALELERTLARRPDVRITLVNRENFSLFTPMLHEVAASHLDVTHIVNPIRKLLKRVRFLNAEVRGIDVAARTIEVHHGAEAHTHTLPYDDLVIALGSITNFAGVPGLEQHAMTMKSLGDAIQLRNRVIDHLEEADFECNAPEREALLTIVVAGGGFAGVETVAAVNDFVREAVHHYPHLTERDLKLVLVHSGPAILPELGESLGRYAQQQLAARGVEIILNARVTSAGHGCVELSNGRAFRTHTLVWTAGTAAHPLLAGLPCARERGRVLVEPTLEVAGHPGVWAIGDCAAVPAEAPGTFHPPTAQHALRQGHRLAQNLAARIDGRPMRPFRFRTLGQLAAIGRSTGVARILGVQFSGFVAWWLWRTIYLAKLPRLERKLRVMLDWTLDLVFSKDLVQLPTQPTATHRDERETRHIA